MSWHLRAVVAWEGPIHYQISGFNVVAGQYKCLSKAQESLQVAATRRQTEGCTALWQMRDTLLASTSHNIKCYLFSIRERAGPYGGFRSAHLCSIYVLWPCPLMGRAQLTDQEGCYLSAYSATSATPINFWAIRLTKCIILSSKRKNDNQKQMLFLSMFPGCQRVSI